VLRFRMLITRLEPGCILKNATMRLLSLSVSRI